MAGGTIVRGTTSRWAGRFIQPRPLVTQVMIRTLVSVLVVWGYHHRRRQGNQQRRCLLHTTPTTTSNSNNNNNNNNSQAIILNLDNKKLMVLTSELS